MSLADSITIHTIRKSGGCSPVRPFTPIVSIGQSMTGGKTDFLQKSLLYFYAFSGL